MIACAKAGGHTAAALFDSSRLACSENIGVVKAAPRVCFVKAQYDEMIRIAKEKKAKDALVDRRRLTSDSYCLTHGKPSGV